jgi:hypothetical protein
VLVLKGRAMKGRWLGCPVGAEEFGLLQNGLRRPFLLVRRIAEFAENAFDHDAELGADGFFGGPVNGDIGADGFDEFLGDEAQVLIAQSLHGAVVRFQGVVKGDFVLAQASYLNLGAWESVSVSASLSGAVSVTGYQNTLYVLTSAGGLYFLEGDWQAAPTTMLAPTGSLTMVSVNNVLYAIAPQ